MTDSGLDRRQEPIGIIIHKWRMRLRQRTRTDGDIPVSLNELERILRHIEGLEYIRETLLHPNSQSQSICGREAIGEYAKAHWKTVLGWIETRKFPATKGLDGCWRSHRGLINKWIESQILPEHGNTQKT